MCVCVYRGRPSSMSIGRPRSRTIGSSLPRGYGGQSNIRTSFGATHASCYGWPSGAAAPQQMLVPSMPQQTMMPSMPQHTMMPQHLYMPTPQYSMPSPHDHAQYILSQNQVLQGPGGIEHYGVQRVIDSSQAMQHGAGFHSVATAVPRAEQSQQHHHAPKVHMMLPDQPLAVEASHNQGHTPMADDDHKLPSAYRVLGCLWKFGARAVIPRKLKTTVLQQVDPQEWTCFRLALLDEVQIDCLIFIVTGAKPTTRISDLGCKTKGQLRDALVREALRIARAHPERKTGLGADLKNAVTEALRLGYDSFDLPPAEQATIRAEPVPAPIMDVSSDRPQAITDAADAAHARQPRSRFKRPLALTCSSK